MSDDAPHLYHLQPWRQLETYFFRFILRKPGLWFVFSANQSIMAFKDKCHCFFNTQCVLQLTLTLQELKCKSN